MIVFFTHEISDSKAKLIDEEFTHCIKVLRHKVGDSIHLVDGKGMQCQGEILTIEKKMCVVSISKVDHRKTPPTPKAIGIAPTKNISRYEWFLEKATEIGVTDIYPILFKQSERKHIKNERSNKIVRTAFKQSLRFYEPTLHPLLPYEQFLKLDLSYNQKFIAHFGEQNKDLKDLGDSNSSSIVLIGPEGDFREEEIKMAQDKDYQIVNISENRLRTETAGVVALNFIV